MRTYLAREGSFSSELTIAHPVWASNREFDHRSKHSQQDFFYFRRGKGEVVPKSSRTEPAQQPQPFHLHRFLVNAKIITVEIASAVVFVWWVVRALIHELR
jgi:hypothetical protein